MVKKNRHYITMEMNRRRVINQSAKCESHERTGITEHQSGCVFEVVETILDIAKRCSRRPSTVTAAGESETRDYNPKMCRFADVIDRRQRRHCRIAREVIE